MTTMKDKPPEFQFHIVGINGPTEELIAATNNHQVAGLVWWHCKNTSTDANMRYVIRNTWTGEAELPKG